MRLRDLTAGLLAFVLACGAAWAGVCPLRCGLRRAVHVAGTEEMAMPGGHCDGMMAAAGKHTVSVGCEAVPCDHAEVSPAVADEGLRASLVMAQTAVVVEVVAVQPLQRVGVAWGEAEGPPRTGVGFDPLIVALRV